MINGLLPYCEEKGLVRDYPLALLKDKRLGINATKYIDQLLALQAKEPYVTALGGLPLALSSRIEDHLRLLEVNRIKPILIFDGLATLKSGPRTVQNEDRQKKRKEAWEIYVKAKTQEAMVAFGQATHVTTKDVLRQIQRVFKHRKTEFMVAPYIASAQLAYLERHPKQYIHAIWSDTETLLYEGIERLILSINWTANTFTAINKRDLLQDLGLTHEQFVDLSLLAGLDKCPTIPVFHPNDLSVFKPLVHLVQQNRSGINVILQYKDAPTIRAMQYQDLFCKAKCMIKYSMILTTMTGQVMPIALAFPSNPLLTPSDIPSDLHEIFSGRLPDQLYFFLCRALTAGQSVEVLTSGYWIDEQPLCGGQTDDYKRFLKDVMTEHPQSLRAVSLGLISSVLSPSWQQQPVHAVYYFDPNPTQPNLIPHSDPLTGAMIAKTNSWNVKLPFIEEELKRQHSSTIDLMLCLGATSVVKLGARTRTPRNPQEPLDRKDEIIANTIWRFLELRGFLNGVHQNTAAAKALYKAIQSSKVNDKFQEPLYLAVELIRANVLHAGKYGGKILQGGPNFGSDQDRSNMLLVLRVASILPVNFYAKPWDGPVSRELLVFNSFLREYTRSVRCLIESTVMHMLLRGDAKRERTDYVDISLSLPFQMESNTVMGIIVKMYCDVVYNMKQNAGPDTTQEQSNAIKNAAIELMQGQSFSQCIRDVKAELERAFRFWDAVFEAVQILAAEKGAGPQICEQFKQADQWLQPFRPVTG